VALTAVLAFSGCGGGSAPAREKAEGPFGKGASGVWLYQPAGKPKNVVIYFHGQGGYLEATPANHIAWIRHLVSRGSIVVYPRYEMEYELDAMRFAVAGVKTAAKRVALGGLPVLVIGYSRGGALAVEYAAVADRNGLPVPDWIMSVFPAGFGDQEHPIDLAPIDHSTSLLIQMGDKDTIVGQTGAAYLGRRLQQAGFPGERIQLDFVTSHGNFTADHFAPLKATPGARAAFWEPADRLLAEIDES
jgi:poly(3-hydroxybutyrate) depolymerase